MADDLYAGFTVGSKPLSSLRVIDLKSELDKRSLSKSGSKKDLQERLKRHLQLEKLHESADHNADKVPNLSLQDDAIGTQNEVVKQYLAAQQKTYELQKEARRQIELSADEVGGSETDASSSQDEGQSPLKLSVRKLRAAHQTVKELKESEVVSSEVEEAEDLSDKSHKRSQKVHDDEKTLTQLEKDKEDIVEEPNERKDSLQICDDEMEKKKIEVIEEQAENLTIVKKPESLPNPVIAICKPVLETVEMKENQEDLSKICKSELESVDDTNQISQSNRLLNITDSEMAVAIESISAIAPPTYPVEVEEPFVDVKPVINEPFIAIVREPLVQPLVEKPTQQPVVQEALIDRVVKEALVEPVVKGTMVEPVVKEALVEPVVKETLVEPVVQKPVEENLEQKVKEEMVVQKLDTREIKQAKPSEKGDISEETPSEAVDMVKKSKVKSQDKSQREIEAVKKENSPSPSRNEDENRDKDSTVKKKVKSESHGADQPIDLSFEDDQTPKIEINENIKAVEVVLKTENLNGSKVIKVESSAKEERVTRRRKRSSDTEEESQGSEKRSLSVSRSSDSRSSSPASFRSGSGSYSSPQRRDRKKRIRNTDSEPSSSSDDDQVKGRAVKTSVSTVAKSIKSENLANVESPSASVGKRRKWTNASSTESNEAPAFERRKINRGNAVLPVVETKDEGEKEPLEIDQEGIVVEQCSNQVKNESEEPEEASDKKDTLVLDLHATDETMGVSDNEKDLIEAKPSSANKKKVDNEKTEVPKISTASVEPAVERVKKIMNRKISLSGSTSKEEESGGKPARKRKWGSISKVVPVSSPVISTDSLKGLIPDLTPALTVATKLEDMVAVKSSSVAETSLVRSGTNFSLGNNHKMELSKIEESSGPREVSPSRKPVSNILYVRNLVRPFTLNQLKDVLGQTGTTVEDGFWIDKIKSKCYVTYETEEEAIKTRLALHNTRWPLSNPKTLFVDFSTTEELEFQKGGAKPIPPPPTKVETSKEQHQPRDSSRKISESSATGERPRRISTNEDKKHDRGGERTSGPKRMGESSSQHAPSHPIREWDRDKIVQEERRYRGGDARNNRENEKPSRSKERTSKDRRGDKKVSETKKKQEETPGKLLDDLFRKTKAAPCIYWLPLTEQQIVQRDEQRKQRMVEREKRRQRIEQEERDRMENERKIRLKERDNRINRDRNPGRRSRSASRSPIRRR